MSLSRSRRRDGSPLVAALYLRVSTGEQAASDLSIPDQRRQLKERCAREGWVVGPEFVDAKSARDDNRPGFQAMFDVVRSGNAPFDLVLVHSYSRFYRENVGLELYYRTLRKRKIELISITQDVGEGSTADLIRQINALLDEHTSRETAKHVERGLKENARQNFFNGSSVPFGLQSVVVEARGRKVKKRLDIEPVEADVVRKIFDLYLRGHGSSGRMGVASIAEWLNANGYRTRKGKLWGNAGNGGAKVSHGSGGVGSLRAA